MRESSFAAKLKDIVLGQAATHNSGISVGVGNTLENYYDDLQSAHDQVETERVGDIATFKDGSITHIVLLADIEMRSKLDVTTDTVIHLNGHELRPGPRFEFSNSQPAMICVHHGCELTLEGSKEGSRVSIPQNGCNYYIRDNSMLSIISIQGGEVYIQGGTYSVTANIPNACTAVNIISGELMSLEDAQIVMQQAGGSVYGVRGCKFGGCFNSTITVEHSGDASESTNVYGVWTSGDSSPWIERSNIQAYYTGNKDAGLHMAGIYVDGTNLLLHTSFIEALSKNIVPTSVTIWGIYISEATKQVEIENSNVISAFVGIDSLAKNGQAFITRSEINAGVLAVRSINTNVFAKESRFARLEEYDLRRLHSYGSNSVCSFENSTNSATNKSYLDGCFIIADESANYAIAFRGKHEVYISNTGFIGKWDTKNQLYIENTTVYLGANVSWNGTVELFNPETSVLDRKSYYATIFSWDDSGNVSVNYVPVMYHDAIEDVDVSIESFDELLPNTSVGVYYRKYADGNPEGVELADTYDKYAKHLVLVEDIELSEKLTLDPIVDDALRRDIDKYVIHLNGYQIRMAVGSAYLCPTTHCVIDGYEEGSSIVNTVADYLDRETSRRVIVSEAGALEIYGGEYVCENTLEDSTPKGLTIIIGNYDEPITIKNAKLRLVGRSSNVYQQEDLFDEDGNRIVEDTQLGTLKGNATCVACYGTFVGEDIEVSIDGNLRNNRAFAIWGFQTTLRRIKATLRSNAHKSYLRLVSAAPYDFDIEDYVQEGTATFEDIVATLDAYHKESGVSGISCQAASWSATNCDVSATGPAGSPNMDDYGCSAISGNGDVRINGGKYYGSREGCSLQGVPMLLIDGTEFSGSQHGGAYFGQKVRVKNTTFIFAKQRAKTDFGGVPSRFGCLYTSTGAEVYMDNCHFAAEVSCSHGFVCNSRYYTPVMYVSNITFEGPMANRIRIDKGRTVYAGAGVDHQNKLLLTTDHHPAEGNPPGILDEGTYAGVRFCWDEFGNVLINSDAMNEKSIGEGVSRVVNSESVAYYNTLSDAITQSSPASLGPIARFSDSESVPNIVLLEDVELTDSPIIDKKMKIRLNGYTLAVPEHLYIGIETEAPVVFDGLVPGSKMYKRCSTFTPSDTDETVCKKAWMIQEAWGSTDVSFYGGTYECEFTGEATGGGGCLCSSQSHGNWLVEDVTILTHADIKTLRLYGILCYSDLVLRDVVCNISGSTDAAYAASCLGEQCEVIRGNYLIQVENFGERCYGVVHNPYDFSTETPTPTNGNCLIIEATISSESAADYADENGTAHAVGNSAIESSGILEVFGGSYYATREALNLHGPLSLLYGGAFEGCQHSNAFTRGKVCAKDSAFRNVVYRGPACGEQKNRFTSDGGCIYCYNDAEVYLDNCEVGNASNDRRIWYGLVAKGSAVKMYLSNITFIGNISSGDIRADANNIVYKGVNVPNRSTSVKGTLDDTTYEGVVFIWDKDGNILDFYREGRGQGYTDGFSRSAGAKITSFYSTLEDALAETNPVLDGAIGVFTDEDGYHLILAENIEQAASLTIARKCQLHLNGKKIHLRNNSRIICDEDVVIEGLRDGSEIYASRSFYTAGLQPTPIEGYDLVGISEATYTYIIVSNKKLTILGGRCTLNVCGNIADDAPEFAPYAILGRGETLAEKAEVSVVSDAVHIKHATGIYASTLELDQTKVSVRTNGLSGYAVNIAGKHISTRAYIEDSEIICTTYAAETAAYGVYFSAGMTEVPEGQEPEIIPSYLTLLRSKITAFCETEQASPYAVHTSRAINEIVDCEIVGNGCVSRTEKCTKPSTGIQGVGGRYKITGSTVYGTREAVSLSPAMAIFENSIFEGCSHGVYLSNNVRARSCTFRNVESRHPLGMEAPYLAAIYTGTSAKLYLDNCSIEARDDISDSVAWGIVVNNRYPDTAVYLSNIKFSGTIAADIRVDLGRTCYLGENVEWRNGWYYHTHNESDPEDVEDGVIDTESFAGVKFTWDTEGNVMVANDVWAAMTTGNKRRTTFASAFSGSTFREVPGIKLRGSMSQTFAYCEHLEKAGPIDTEEVSNLSLSFRNCGKLRWLSLTHINATTTTNMLQGCFALTDFFVGVISTSVNFSDCPMLTAASAQRICKALAESSGKTLTLCDAVIERLTSSGNPPSGDSWSSYLASKGWTLVAQTSQAAQDYLASLETPEE